MGLATLIFMGFLGGKLGYRILRKIAPKEGRLVREASNNSVPEAGVSEELLHFFGEDFFDIIQGKSVIEFGCGEGREALEMVKMGAAKVIGLDIQEKRLEFATNQAKESGVEDRCEFVRETDEATEIIVSKDAFEHFSNPAAVLGKMRKLLRPGGVVLASFGPTWLHPRGGHLFSIFPWAHLIFTEKALIRWRSDFKKDEATRFSEVEGGLNQMTIAKFEKIVEDSPFTLEKLEAVPIRGIKLLGTRPLREFGASIIRCRLGLGNRAATTR